MTSSSDEPDPRSRWEKARGMAWMFGALIAAVLIVGGFVEAAKIAGTSSEAGIGAAAVLAWDALVFQWGVKRFDITPPKYFREAAE